MMSFLRPMLASKQEVGLRDRYKCIAIYIVAFILIWISFNSYAETPSIHILDRVDATFKPLQDTWYTAIRAYAEVLFWLLVLVDFGWSAIIYVLEKNDITEIITSFTKKIFSIGFFWGLLKLSDTWVPAIINSFRQIGTSVGNVSSVTPDGIVSTGFELAKGAFMLLKGLGVIDVISVVFPITFIAILVFLAFLFVAAQLLVTLIESYIAVGAGVILLGFGGSRWTTDFATKYLQYAVGTGLKLMILYLIVGSGQTLFDSMVLDTENLMASCLAAMGSAVTYAFLAIQVPQIASSMMSGSPSLTAGAMAGAAIQLGAAAAGAAAATGAATRSATTGGTKAAAGATGLANALGAGYNAALDMGLSGLNAGAHSVGEVAKHGLGLASSGIGNAVSGGKSTFAEKVGASTGGKIASGIESTRGGSMSNTSPTPSASSGSGVANGKTPATNGGSGNLNVPTGSAPTASTQPLTGGTGAVPTSEAVPPPTASSSGLGDASAASLSSPVGGNVSNGENGNVHKVPLHERIQALQGYVPQDMASGATINIDLKHTAD